MSREREQSDRRIARGKSLGTTKDYGIVKEVIGEHEKEENNFFQSEWHKKLEALGGKNGRDV